MAQVTYPSLGGGLPSQARRHALIAAGSNLDSTAGPPAATLLEGIDLLSARGLVIRSVSALYATPCFPEGAGPDYVNAALAVEADRTPQALLEELHAVEARLGRERVQRWGQRTLDLDLLAVGSLVLPDARTQRAWMDLAAEDQATRAPDALVLPHPRLQDRAFVLVPLLDIAPDWVHPCLGRSVRQMHDALPEHARAGVKRLVFPDKRS